MRAHSVLRPFAFSLALLMAELSSAQASLISQLSTDFSQTDNPNGLWSYYADTGNALVGMHLLPHTPNNGIFGEGFGTVLGEPSIFLCSGIGTVCVYPSFYEGQYIRWTLPEASTLTISATLALVPPVGGPYPASAFDLTVAGLDIFASSGSFIPGDPGVYNFNSVSVFPAGTIVQMYTRSLGCCGYFADLDVKITAHDIDVDVPEPGTLSLLSFGFAAVWLGTRRRKR